jgi:hypothetical protein
MKSYPLLLLVIIIVSYLPSACSPINNGTPQEVKTNSPVKVKVSYGDVKAIVPFKQEWIDKIDINKLSGYLSPNGKWILINDLSNNNQYYIMSTIPPYETIQMQIIPSLFYWYGYIWSPDGKSIAIVGGNTTKMGPTEQVVIYTIDEKKVIIPKIYLLPTPITYFHIKWSPNGSQLAIADGDSNKIIIIDRNAQLQKEIGIENLHENHNFNLIWSRTGLMIGIRDNKDYKIRQYDSSTWNYQNLLTIKGFTTYDGASVNPDGSELFFKNHYEPNSEQIVPFEMLKIDLSNNVQTQIFSFDDMDGGYSKYKIIPSNLKWLAILGASQKGKNESLYHIYLFNQSSYELVDYGIGEDLIGWYPGANGFLMKREVNGKNEIDILTPPTEK